MPDWHTIVIPFATLVIGFLLRILQERILEKKVGLCHKMEEPSIFESIPPMVCFQNLKIWNKGKLPAKNVRVNLKASIIEQYEIEYKPVTDEKFSEENTDSIRTLKFERLLPKEELVISFKAKLPIPGDFLTSIKSDEMVSQISRDEEGIRSSMANYVGIAVTSVIIAGFVYFVVLNPGATRSFAEINLMTDKPVYSKNQQMEIAYKIRNITGQPLGDLRVLMEIPGFNLDYDSKYKKKSFLGAQEEFFQKIPLQVPDDIPPGKYKINVTVIAESLDKTLLNKSRTFFEVR